MSYSFLIGTDPEEFVKRDGRFISAHDLIPGTKEEPYPVNMGAVQRDGVAAEFNIVPAETKKEFREYIRTVQKQLEDMLPPGYELVAEPTAWFEQEYFDNLEETPKMLGCTPDYNAYTGTQNPPPGTDLPFRTGSGHIHIGWDQFLDVYDENFLCVCRNLVKQLDQALYYPSLSWDTDTQRRKLYGKMGSFRPKPYGLEYRVLSNAYLRDDAVIDFVYERTIWACDLFFNRGVRIYEDAPDVPEAYR
jgi:hypothetical protein